MTRAGAHLSAKTAAPALTCPQGQPHTHSPKSQVPLQQSSSKSQPAPDGAHDEVSLSDALADGDPIYAVLLGAAVNNDGAERASFTAPSPEGQAAVVATNGRETLAELFALKAAVFGGAVVLSWILTMALRRLPLLGRIL